MNTFLPHTSDTVSHSATRSVSDVAEKRHANAPIQPMHLALDELKIKAKKQLKALRGAEDESTTAPIKLKDIQHKLAKALGFSDFNQAREVLSGQVTTQTQLQTQTPIQPLTKTQSRTKTQTSTQPQTPHAVPMNSNPNFGICFGTFWYSKSSVKFANQWFSHYQEAKAIHQLGAYFLLPYKTQFLLVNEAFLLDLGLEQRHIQWLNDAGRDFVSIYPSMLWDSIAQTRIRQLIQV